MPTHLVDGTGDQAADVFAGPEHVREGVWEGRCGLRATAKHMQKHPLNGTGCSGAAAVLSVLKEGGVSAQPVTAGCMQWHEGLCG